MSTVLTATSFAPTNTAQAGDFNEAGTAWTVPFGWTATTGRLLVLTVSCRSTDPTSQVAVPAGWTQVVNRLDGGGVSPRLQVMYRVAVGGETQLVLTKTTAIGFYGAIVDEYPCQLLASPADQATSLSGNGVEVTTLSAATAMSASRVVAFTAIAIREGTASSGLALSGESWYQRAAYRVPAATTLLMCTGAGQVEVAEVLTGTWAWTQVNRACAATFTLRLAPILREGILWVNDQDTWVRADMVHPFGYKTGWKEPWEVWAKDGETDIWYGAWPRQFPTVYPAILNLRATAVTSTSATVAWDALPTTPIRYRGVWSGPGIADTTVDLGLATTSSMTGLTAASVYTFSVRGEYADGASEPATLQITTGTSTPPSITSWTPQTYNSVSLVVAGTAPFTLRCVGGTRNGQTFAWAATGTQTIGSCVGKEYWQVENAGGITSRFYTDDGTPAQSAIVGAVRTSLANPLPLGFGRGSCAGLDWGAPAMSAHPNFPYSNTNDGTGATRWQTGNYPRGWIQHTIGIPGNYRVRRFMFVQGDGAGNTQMVTPVYSVDSGATFKRYSHFGAAWIPATDATIHPGTTSPNGLLSIDSAGNWQRDWNWQLTTAATLATPFIPEQSTDLSQRWIYVRWGIVHQTGSFGANMGECWIEYQEPSTPAKAEVKATIAWG